MDSYGDTWSYSPADYRDMASAFADGVASAVEELAGLVAYGALVDAVVIGRRRNASIAFLTRGWT